MKQTDIVLPVAALVAWTALVAMKMLYDRVTELASVRRKAADVQKIADKAVNYSNVRASNHFQNLFECPVLFYTLALVLLSTKAVTPMYVNASWAYVALRLVHGVIACTYNNMIHRFIPFILSTTLLFCMWGYYTMGLLLE